MCVGGSAGCQRTRMERQVGARSRKESQVGKNPWTAVPVHRQAGRRQTGAGMPTGLHRAAWWWRAASCLTRPARPGEDLAVQTREEQGLLGRADPEATRLGEGARVGRLTAVTSLRLCRILF